MLSGMDQGKTALERAFEIAKTGASMGVTDIRDQLRAEGYEIRQLEGRSLTSQLRSVLEKAKADAKRT